MLDLPPHHVFLARAGGRERAIPMGREILERIEANRRPFGGQVVDGRGESILRARATDVAPRLVAKAIADTCHPPTGQQ